MTPPGYSIGLARPEHIPALAAIELAAAQMAKGHAPDSLLAQTVDQSILKEAARAGRLWIALKDDAPVGFAVVRMLAPDLPHLEEIDVHPAHGHRGLGSALVRTVCEWAAASGYARLTLLTFRALPWNFPFYARMGFAESPREGLRPELAAALAREAALGLDPDTRALMAKEFNSL